RRQHHHRPRKRDAFLISEWLEVLLKQLEQARPGPVRRYEQVVRSGERSDALAHALYELLLVLGPVRRPTNDRKQHRELILYAMVDLAQQRADAPFIFLGGGDVARDLGGPDDVAGGVLYGRDGQRHEDEGAVLAQAGGIEAGHALVALDLLDDLRLLTAEAFGNDHQDRLPDGFLGRIAEH